MWSLDYFDVSKGETYHGWNNLDMLLDISGDSFDA